ncbi:15161_t:CDS:2 [Dentiscutata heterogama]|uniref:15161_t:CDS:1 n=1 Tax=Dentiscutata heterogama TaxID=1316150 RepID=A0ACA9LBC4_9GLOM|nr:15161_t:CDS:2 [Dentiscutata heterogama]
MSLTFPEYNTTLQQFSCPITQYSNYNLHTTFFAQVGFLFSSSSLIFTIAVYGAGSIFGYIKTCRIDNIVILTTSLVPIFSWYSLIKLYWYGNIMCKTLESTNKICLFLESSIFFILVLLLVVVVIVIFMILICSHFFYSNISGPWWLEKESEERKIRDIHKHGHYDAVFATIKVNDISKIQECYIEMNTKNTNNCDNIKLKKFRIDYVDDDVDNNAKTTWIEKILCGQPKHMYVENVKDENECYYVISMGNFYFCKIKLITEADMKDIEPIIATEKKDIESITETAKKVTEDSKGITITLSADEHIKTNIKRILDMEVKNCKKPLISKDNADINSLSNNSNNTILEIIKIDKDNIILIDVLNTGFLNYLIYSHQNCDDIKNQPESPLKVWVVIHEIATAYIFWHIT